MNDALKQRLVGAGVLLILAGLLWPLLFDFDERLVREAPVKTFPAMPDIARADIAAKPTVTSVNTAARREPISAQMARDADSETAAQSRTTAQSKKAAKAAALARTDRSLHASKSSQVETPHTSKTSSGKPVVDESRPRLDTNGVPIAWVIQTGTFSRWANASGLRDKLVAKGHKAYIKPVAASAPAPYTVYVGPLLTSAQAKAVATEVRRAFALPDAMVLRFKVVD